MSSKCKREPKRLASKLPAARRRCTQERKQEPDTVDYMAKRNIGKRIADGFALAGIQDTL